MRLSKFSVVSDYSNRLYCSEGKPRNVGNYQVFENFEFPFSVSQNSTDIRQNVQLIC